MTVSSTCSPTPSSINRNSLNSSDHLNNDSIQLYGIDDNQNTEKTDKDSSKSKNNNPSNLPPFENFQCFLSRRQRGEKRPIPDEQKDDKYFERRKRNNEAAKKSRDARKMREDRVSFTYYNNKFNAIEYSFPK